MQLTPLALFVAPLLPSIADSPAEPVAAPAVAEALPSTLTARPDGSSWRTDPAWYDGKAEKCVYEAARSIYGVERTYEAIAYTNKQQMDRRTTTKSGGGAGAKEVEVFKHHWSERVPTEKYDYDFSTASFIQTADLRPFKLTVATQEDCGASFKQVVADGSTYSWLESVYFPGAGLEQGELRESELVFEDSLSLVLRDYAAADKPLNFELTLLPSQKSTRSVPFQPATAKISDGGEETLDLPVGSVRARRVDVATPGGRSSYWFATSSEAPWLHALVRFEGPGGVRYRLKSIERTAYWER